VPARYHFIICTYACPLASTSVTGENICIHYQPMMGDYVITAPKGSSEAERSSASEGLPDLFPIVPWQTWYQVSDSAPGVLCLEPRERSPSNLN
jgi:hypothetical protein